MNSLAVQQRQVARCAHCGMNQFVPVSGLCRGCHRGLLPEVKPEAPAPLVVVRTPILVGDFSHIGPTIRILREQSKLTQRQLAFRMCVARTYVSKVEGGKCTPTIALLDRFAKGLRVDIPTLLRGPVADPFIAEIAPYVAQLSESQRSTILAALRNFAPTVK
jgi:transcriptional regulator with XRE-family HTH domain